MAYERIEHAGGAPATTVSGSLTSGATTVPLASGTGWPTGGTGNFYAVIDRGTPDEELIKVATRVANNLTSVTRGADGSSARAHSAGAPIEHCFTATEADEANQAVNKTLGLVTTKGDLIAATAANALGRLAAGANNTVLRADSSQATGLRYAQVDAAAIASSVAGNGLAGGNGTALSVTVDGVTIQITGDSLSIPDAAITAAKIAAAVAGNGLTGGAGTPLAVGAGTGLTVAANDVGITAGGVGTTQLADAGVTAAKIAAAVAGDGLAGGAGTALSVSVDGTTVAITADVLGVKADGIGSAQIADDAIGVEHIAVVAANGNNVLEANEAGTAVAYTGRGRSWAKSMDTDSGGVGTTPGQILALNIANPTLKAGRRYKVEFSGQMQIISGTGHGYVQIRRGGNLLNKQMTPVLSALTNIGVNQMVYFEPGVDVTGDWDIYLEAITANVKIVATATQLASFVITDVGFSTNAD